MAGIETLYLTNHSHTDIGFTDYQGVCFRQHCEFVDGALDLVEATADYPEGSRYRWTCEVTGPLLRWLRTASPAQVERFRRHHEQGAIDVAGMQYNLTPLLNVEQLCRSLYPLRALREEYGKNAGEPSAPGGIAGGVSGYAGLEDAEAVEGEMEATEAPQDPAP